MNRFLKYKASPVVKTIVRDEGLKPEHIGVFAGPAGGPKWFISVGFDRALMSSGFLIESGRRVLLAGSSAGAWRCIAMACRDPEVAYEKLRIAYSRNVFDATDTPGTVSKALRQNVESFLTPEDIRFILEHPHFDLAVFTVRSKGIAASSNKHIEGMGLLASSLANALTPAGMKLFYERTLFHTGPKRTFMDHFSGQIVPLNMRNMAHAALATGSLPYIVAGVTDIPDAPPGVYRDGGLTDYQLNQDFIPGDKITLFLHYQERIIPGWFDKMLKWRRPASKVLNRVLQVYPSDEFVALLPNKRIPDRNDFIEYVNNPAERIRIWDEVSEKSSILGEQFFEDIESGRIRDLIQDF